MGHCGVSEGIGEGVGEGVGVRYRDVREVHLYSLWDSR